MKAASLLRAPSLSATVGGTLSSRSYTMMSDCVDSDLFSIRSDDAGTTRPHQHTHIHNMHTVERECRYRRGRIASTGAASRRAPFRGAARCRPSRRESGGEHGGGCKGRHARETGERGIYKDPRRDGTQRVQPSSSVVKSTKPSGAHGPGLFTHYCLRELPARVIGMYDI